MIFERTSILAAAVASLAALGGSSSTARADFFSDLDIRVNVGRPAPQRVWVEPVYEMRCDRVWVAPVYQTQCVPVCHEAVYEDQQVQAWVPDRFETRRERYRDECGRIVTREVCYVACAGHYETQCQRVLVRGPYTEQVEQQVCVSAGYWQNVERRVIVRDGYWQDACPPSRPQVRVDVDARRDDSPRWDRGDRHDPRGDAGRRYGDRRDDDRRHDDDRRGGGYYGGGR